jgi:hypothetical protein
MLSRNPDIKDIKAESEIFKKILISTMKLIADRYERDPDYKWIDTKLNIITGLDFPDEDNIRSKNIIYSWIQGRGLESLSLHCKWIRNNCSDKTSLNLAGRLEIIIDEVSISLKRAKKINSEHLFFFMNSEGKALKAGKSRNWIINEMSSGSAWNTSDMFVSRGLFTASLFSESIEARSLSLEYIMNVSESVKKGGFVTDQQALAEGNPVANIKGRFSQSPWMLLIGSMTLLLKHGEKEALEWGIYAIRHILDKHVNTPGKWNNLENFDYIEYISEQGDPWDDHGKVLSDPGHALEFVGLSLEFCSVAKSVLESGSEILLELDEISSSMFPIFRRNFINGYNRKSEGIVKLFDLVSRKPVNSQMPWWSLPETMRAALGSYQIIKNEADRSFCLEVYSLCHNSLFNNYIKEDSPGLLAVQTRDEKGRIIDSIPAVPDADPGYHTGLALIDCLEMIDEQ